MDRLFSEGVIRSITEFWFPTFGWIIGIILIIFLIKKFKKK